MAVSQSQFDDLIRQEMRSAGRSRGGETDTQGARDAVARRLNIKEGRTGGGNTSTAYRPARPGAGGAGGRGRNTSRGGGKSRGGGVPTPTPRPPNENYDDPYGTTGRPMPTGTLPDQTAAGDTGVPWWLVPILSKLAYGAGRKFAGAGGVDMGLVEPTRVTQPVEGALPGNDPRLIAAQNEPQRMLPKPTAGALPPPPAGGSSPIDDMMARSEPTNPRFYTPEEMAQMQAAAERMRMMADPSVGAGGGRMGGGAVDLPPIRDPNSGWAKPWWRILK